MELANSENIAKRLPKKNPLHPKKRNAPKRSKAKVRGHGEEHTGGSGRSSEDTVKSADKPTAKKPVFVDAEVMPDEARGPLTTSVEPEIYDAEVIETPRQLKASNIPLPAPTPASPITPVTTPKAPRSPRYTQQTLPGMSRKAQFKSETPHNG